TTGVDLTRDFTQAGLDAKGLPGVMDDIQKATHGNSSEILRLIPNMRGGLAAMVLAGTGAKDYSSILGQLNDTMSGKLTPTADAYARTQQTLAFQTAELKNNLQLAGIAIGTVLLPPITKLAQLVVPLIQDFAQWSQAHAQLATGILATVGALGTLAGGFQMVRMAGMLLGPVLGPVVGLLGGFLWPILAVAAAGAALYIAWQNDWGGIREITQQVARQIQGIVTTVLGVIQTTWDAHSQAIMALARQAWGIIQSIITAVVGAVRQFILEEFGVVIDWAKANWPLIQETISDVMNKVLDVVQMVLGGLVSFWQANGATIMAVVRLAWDMVKAIIDTAIHVVLDLITLTMDLITGHWQGAWNQVLDILSRIWGLIKKLVGDEMAILGTILDSFVPELLAKAQELGAAIMNGIKAGIEAGVGALKDAVANAAQGALNAAKSALGIHSPSTAFATIGQQMAQGLANGITANAHLAANAARQMAQATLAFSLGTSSSGGAGMLAPAAFTGSVEPFVPPTLSGGWGGSGGSQGGPAATFAPVITLYNYGALGVNDAEDWLVSTMQQAWRQGRFDTMFAMPIH
ncbi:MAG: phage tail tape measure protein, partial [Chloroflexota bacterium]